MRDILDKLVEYRSLVIQLEELRKKHGGKLTIKIAPNVKITERWEFKDDFPFYEIEFRLSQIDKEIIKLKDKMRKFQTDEKHET